MRTQKHVHRLKRHAYETGNKIFFCTLPDCSFKSQTELMLGKRVICNRCNKEFILNQRSIRLALPHCDDCSKVRVKTVEGETKYVSKEQLSKPVSTAADKTKDLRSRLSVVGTQSNSKDDDGEVEI